MGNCQAPRYVAVALFCRGRLLVVGGLVRFGKSRVIVHHEWSLQKILKELACAPERATVQILQTWFPEENFLTSLERLYLHEGTRFLVARGGGALARVDQVELDGLNACIDGVEFVIASDVDNPLLGPRGAAAVFGPQKGATREHAGVLERSLSRWASVVAATTGQYAAETLGAGAAGGVGFAGISILNAAFRSRPSVGWNLPCLHARHPRTRHRSLHGERE
jgi:hypothetical protein